MHWEYDEILNLLRVLNIATLKYHLSSPGNEPTGDMVKPNRKRPSDKTIEIKYKTLLFFGVKYCKRRIIEGINSN